MARPSVLFDQLNIDFAIQSITADAVPVLVSGLRSAGPLYPWEELLPDLVSRLLERLLTTREPTDADHRDIVAAARRCARDWVPLQELELCGQILLACVFRYLWRTIRPRATTELLVLGGQTSAALPIVLTTTRRAYIEEMGRAGERRAEELVIAALLQGGDAVSLARDAGIVLPEPGLCVCVTDSDAIFGEVPREVRDRVGDGALCAATTGRTHLVVVTPCPDPDPESAPAVRAFAEGLAEVCGEVLGRECVAGLSLARAPADLAGCVAEAMTVGDLLARVGGPGRAAFLLDTLPEAVLAERSDLRVRLLERLAGVRSNRLLWRTLRALYECDLDRGRTARSLGIHRSTLDYRLNRVEQLTGVSPTGVRGIVLFSAGLAADALSV